MSMNFHSDNVGNRIPPHANLVHPTAAGGLKKSCAIALTNYTLAVVAGTTYKATARVAAGAAGSNISEVVFLGITGTTVTDANKEWVFSIGSSAIIHIPNDKTTINISSTIANTDIYLSKAGA